MGGEMKKIYLLVMLIVGISCLDAGAKTEKVWMEKPSGKMVEEARASTKQVSIVDVKNLWDGDDDIVLLDVRTPREYEAIHIPGAESAPRGLLEFIIWKIEPDENAKIYVYCRTGSRAALATKLLNKLGYKNAVRIDTGMAEWAKSGYPVQTSFTDEELILLPADE
jgi:rhodanese-related sulfurtransferase